MLHYNVNATQLLSTDIIMLTYSNDVSHSQLYLSLVVVVPVVLTSVIMERPMMNCAVQIPAMDSSLYGLLRNFGN